MADMKKCVLVSYVSLNRDLGGPGSGIGEEDAWRPATAIAHYMKEKAGKAPDAVRLIWEADYMEKNGKGSKEWDALRKKVAHILPRADIQQKLIVWPEERGANEYKSAFRELDRLFGKMSDEFGEDAELFVNVSTGTHAVMAALFILAARNEHASIVQVGNDEGREYCLITNVAQSTRAADVEKAEEDAKASSRKTPEVDEEVAKDVLNVAPLARDPILLLGETGTGKTRLAEMIAEARGIKGDKFVAVNCATLGTLADSELFGHVEGGFTDAKKEHRGYVEQANGGLLFLDEVGLLSPEVQGKLLKVLDNGKYRRVGGEQEYTSDFFLVCGTNADLSKEVADKMFRRDLYERLRTWTFQLPPLRERPINLGDDIDVFLNIFNKTKPKTGSKAGTSRFASKAKERLVEKVTAILQSEEGKRIFAGNYRSLRRLVRRLATRALGAGGRIDVGLVEREINEFRKEGLRDCLAEETAESGKAAVAKKEGLRDCLAEETAESGKAPVAKVDDTPPDQMAIAASVVRELLGDSYEKVVPLKRAQLEYVVGLFVAKKDTKEIKEFLFPNAAGKGHALDQFLRSFHCGFGVKAIRDAVKRTTRSA